MRAVAVINPYSGSACRPRGITTPKKRAATTTVQPVADRDHCLGPVDAPSSLVEYADYESSECGTAYWVVKSLVKERGDELCFAYRNFPLASSHPHAQAAAEAAEAADEQGRFWLMHDRLFEHRENLDDASIREIARTIPLDMHEFERDLQSGAPARRVTEDVESGRLNGVRAAPTFFVNGRRHTGPSDFLPLLKALTGEQ